MNSAQKLNIAIVGGGKACKSFLELIFDNPLSYEDINVVGVADINENAPGFKYAKEKGVYTTKNYKEFYKIKNLDLILELTGNDKVRDEIAKTKPSCVELIGHGAARLLWSFIEQIQEKIWLYKVNAICAAASSSVELEELIRTIASEVMRVLGIDSIGIYLKKEGGRLELIYSEGYSEKFYEKPIVSRNVGDGIIGKVAQEGEIIIFEDLTKSDTPYLDIALKEGLRSAAYIPLIAKGEVLGVMRASSHTSHIFSPQDVSLLIAIGRRIGEGIEKALHYDWHKKISKELERGLKKSYEELKKSEEKYKSLFNANPNPIFIVDRQTLKILDANTRAVDSFGYNREEFLKMSFTDLCVEKDENILSCLRSISSNQLGLCHRRRLRKKSGETFYANVYGCLSEFMGREALIVTTTDITEVMKKEAQLIQAAKMGTLGQMAAGIAHELNQPLTVIKAGSDFLLRIVKEDEQINKEELSIISEEISHQIDRASGIIEHLRNFSRASEPKKTRININKPIKDVFKMLGQQLKVHQIDVRLELDENLPDIMADHNRLEQVFVNLITNAMDAMDEKEKWLGKGKVEKILTIQSYRENGKVVVKVSDTGVGIPQKNIDKIFEPFFTTKEVGKGTGLGLSISYAIIKDYGGIIEVKSEEGEGTTFILKFPSVKE